MKNATQPPPALSLDWIRHDGLSVYLIATAALLIGRRSIPARVAIVSLRKPLGSSRKWSRRWKEKREGNVL